MTSAVDAAGTEVPPAKSVEVRGKVKTMFGESKSRTAKLTRSGLECMKSLKLKNNNRILQKDRQMQLYRCVG
jgi:hypothetical protein